MKAKEDGGPAFPVGSKMDASHGMSLRDFFAAAALQGVIAADTDAELTPHNAVELAYGHADLMLRFRRIHEGAELN